MIRKFNVETLKVLENGGWFPGRDVGRYDIELKLKNAGFIVFGEVIDFLTEFEGLRFNFFNRRRGKSDDFNFVLDRVLEIEVPERVLEDYMPRTGERLCIIGTCYREHFILFLSNTGRMYGAYDDYLVLMGESIYAAIDNIVYSSGFTEIK